jgi:hypothetical protein
MEDQDKQDQDQELEEGAEGDVQEDEEVEGDRPAKNWKAEIERKEREAARLRAELDAERSRKNNSHDPKDLSTWSDEELKAVIHSNNPEFIAFKGQAQDHLDDRRLERKLAAREETSKKVTSDLTLRKEYPEAFDPSTEFGSRVEQVMSLYSLQKSPAGRLAAAKIVEAEMQKGAAKSDANGRKAEADRVRGVKAQMVDGDRPKPTESKVSPKKIEDLERRIMKADENAVGEVLKDRGISPENFFKR